MRKLILILSTLMIVIALGGPVLTGHYAERIVREGQPLVVDALPDWLQLVESSYKRGWFNATASHRLLVTDPERAGMLRSWLGDGDFGDQPAIVVQSKIAHGPIVNIATLALADVRSRLAVDGGEAGKDLPALLNTRIGLSGTTEFRTLLADGAFERPQGDVSWSRVVLSYTPVAAPQPLVIDMTADAIQFAGASRESRIEDIATTLTLMPTSPGATVDVQYTANVPDVAGAPSAAQGTFSLEGISAQALVAARNLAVTAQQSAAAEPWWMRAEQAAELRTALANPLTLRWQQDLQSTAGELSMTLSAETPAADIVPLAANAQTFLQAMLVNSNMTLKAQTTDGYLEHAASNDAATADQIAMFKGVGALQREGDSDRYTMTITGADGSLLMNGRPMFNSAPR